MSKDVIYGKNAVLEALRAGRQVYKLVVTHEVIKKEGEMRKLIQTLNIDHEVVDSKKLKQLAHQRYNISGQFQGLVAEVATYDYLGLDDLLETVKKREKPAFLVMLDGLEDVHNLGAIVRSAEAVGVDAIIIPKHGSVGLGSTVARLSAGAIEYVPVVQVANLNRTIERMKKAGIWLVGTDAGESEDYRAVDMTLPVCVVIGSEGRGMSRLVKAACDFKVHLPMIGKMTSLNASVAAALLMYEVYNQRNPRIKA
ncbi:MAG: 23S rRNA (guanosine(2251)-2'-O)-methyltransferase RlmB [Defluviitaleaceae bacterium]|nr:23S rRNA (guanosine(2251)-2'-O)-methyltransferase RlmB [Defluviitaleaceae bacterium]